MEIHEIHSGRASVETVLNPPPPRGVILIVLALLVMVAFVLPLSILFIDQLEIGFGYILTLAIFGGTALYFSRKLFWAFWGREVFTIGESEVKHYYDYGIFKDGLRTSKYTSVKVGFSKMKNPDQVIFSFDRNLPETTTCYLVIVTENEVIRSHVSTTLKNVSKLSKVLDRG